MHKILHNCKTLGRFICICSTTRKGEINSCDQHHISDKQNCYHHHQDLSPSKNEKNSHTINPTWRTM